jgi:hypothetical protein
MRLLVLIMLASCWREAPPPEEPQSSFVARVHTLAELRRGTNALAPELEATKQRIVGLASEAERSAIHADLAAMEHEVSRLIDLMERARERGDEVADVDDKLRAAALSVMRLREELRYARTTEEQEAFERLKRKLEGTHDPVDVRTRIYRRDPLAPRPPPDRVVP